MIGMGVPPRLRRPDSTAERPRFLVDVPADVIVRHRKSGRHHILAKSTALVVLLGAAIEGMLLFRLWTQLMSRQPEGILATVYEISDVFVAPFQRYELTTPIKSTGILELATLVALEAYLAVSLAALSLILIVWTGGRIVAFYREPHTVPFIGAPAAEATVEPAVEQSAPVLAFEQPSPVVTLVEPAPAPSTSASATG